MSEMTTRVATAIEQATKEQTHGYDDFPASGLDFDVIACAAVAAMREPTEEMLRAAMYRSVSTGMGESRAEAEEEWRAMIDEALK